MKAKSEPDDTRPRPVKSANQRSAARLAAVQALYQMDIASTPLAEVLQEFEAYRLGQELDGDAYRDADPAWFRVLVSGVVHHQRALDPHIHDALADGWPLRRLDTTLRAILRAGAFELFHRSDVPAPVVISEYVDVAHAFYQDDVPKLVNGVLDGLSKTARADS
jgi:N utilization substance protein B